VQHALGDRLIDLGVAKDYLAAALALMPLKASVRRDL
jgi:hypothetical protein